MPTFNFDTRIENALVTAIAADATVTSLGCTVEKGGISTSALLTSVGASGHVAVFCTNIDPGPFGDHKVQMAAPARVDILCLTRVAQDATGAALQTLAAAVEDVCADSAIVTTLNAAVAGLNVLANGVLLRGRQREDGDIYRQITISLDIHGTVTS